MSCALQLVKRFYAKQEGATVVEYGILLALLSIVAIAAIVIIGYHVNGAFTGVANELDAAGAPKVP